MGGAAIGLFILTILLKITISVKEYNQSVRPCHYTIICIIVSFFI